MQCTCQDLMQRYRCSAGVMEKVRYPVYVTEEFPFLVTKLSPYFDR